MEITTQYSAISAGANAINDITNDPRNSLRYQILAHSFGIHIEAPIKPSDLSNTPTAPDEPPLSNQQSNDIIQLTDFNSAISGQQSLSIDTVSANEEVVLNDPLAIDLNRDGFTTTSINQGIWFDINGDGKPELTSFVQSDNAFLALDRNRNGQIDSGLELFGDQYGAANGFEELRKLDSNQDGWLDALDEQFHRLSLLLLDKNGRLHQQSLESEQISRINVTYQATEQALNTYDRISQIGYAERYDGTLLAAADLQLAALDQS